MTKHAEHGTPSSTGDFDPAICWPAFYSRDARFDGRFFVGVVTTNIYCRSICPVPFARPNNIMWFASAAAAEAAGYQPCRRCRPQAAPGTPAWQGTSAAVSRALKLILEGSLDGGSVDHLADRVGIGGRQLRRLFVQHMGASPKRIAMTRRVHFARNLIEDTDLPITEIALSAGFQSVRQFNHAFHQSYGLAPRDLRRQAEEYHPVSHESGLLMRLSFRPPLDWDSTIAFLKLRAIPGMESASEDLYQRTIEIGDAQGVLEVRPDLRQSQLLVRIHLENFEHLMGVIDRVRRVFDLGADPLQIADHLGRDPLLEPLLAARPGLRVPGAWDGFELCIRTLLGEHLGMSGPNPVFLEKLVERFGRSLKSGTEGATLLFPRPRDLQDADLSEIGLGAEKSKSIKALADAVIRKKLTFEPSKSLEESIARLSVVPGIGSAAAAYIALRVFGEPDAFPAGDAGLKRAFRYHSQFSTVKETVRVAEAWRPWRGYAAMHMVTSGHLCVRPVTSSDSVARSGPDFASLNQREV